MSIDEKLKNMKPSDTPLLVVGYILLGMMLLLGLPAQAQDNEVYINQSGNNLDLQILQAGYGNTIKNLPLTGDASLWGTNKTVKLQQLGNNNDIGMWTSGGYQTLRGHIDGDYNDLFLDAHGDSVNLQADIIGDYNYAWLEAGASNSHSYNELTLYMEGDNHDAYIEAVGGLSNDLDVFMGNGQDGNTVDAVIGSGGDYNSLKVWQGKHDDGTTDTDETGGHYAYWEVHGDSNNLASYQTDTNRGGGGGRYHYLDNYVSGSYNVVEHIQMGKTGHNGYLDIYGSSNTVDIYQRGNGGRKTAQVELNGNGHTVDVWQKGSNSATATVDLTYGTGAYTLDLDQNVTSSAATYTITGICNNSGGCSLTVNQNN